MLSPESQRSIDVDTGVTKINMVTHYNPSAGGMWAVLEAVEISLVTVYENISAENIG
jgi:hypothetical protein